MAISQSRIRLAYYGRIALAAESFSQAKSRKVKTAFLSHSHQDADIARGIQNLLSEAGWTIYIDWQDVEMPETPNRETASRIKGKIVTHDYFLFLATANSMSSRWCPWELGYADAMKGHSNIIVLPTSDGNTSHGNEYIDLYRRIDVDAQGDIKVFTEGYKYVGSSLRVL